MIRILENYDYGTKPSNVDENVIFDTSIVGMGMYDSMLKNKEYYEKRKNIKFDIIDMSPKEYFKEVAKMFHMSVNELINNRGSNTENINYLKDVILKQNETFPMTFFTVKITFIT